MLPPGCSPGSRLAWERVGSQCGREAGWESEAEFQGERGEVRWEPRCSRAWGRARLGRLGRCESRSLRSPAWIRALLCSRRPAGHGRGGSSPSAPCDSERGRAAHPRRTQGTPLPAGARAFCVSPLLGGLSPLLPWLYWDNWAAVGQRWTAGIALQN